MVVVAASRTMSLMPASSALADRVVAVDADLDVQAVVAQQHRRRRAGVALIAGELRGVGQSRRAAVLQRGAERPVGHLVGGRVGVAAGGQRGRRVQELAGAGDDAGAPHRVVLGAPLAAAVLGDDVGAVERVVQTAPAGVGGVQRVARVGHRHDELRPGDCRDLRIDVRRRRGEVLALRHQVADLLQHRLVLRQVDRLVVVLPVPRVDAALQLLALGPAARGSAARGRGPAGRTRTRTPPGRRRCPAAPRR